MLNIVHLFGICIMSFCLLFISNALLLGDKTTPPSTTIASNSFMTESRYNFLMDLLMEERQARRKLEEEIIQLRTRVDNSEQNANDFKIKLEILSNNENVTNIVSLLSNKTHDLQNKYDALVIENNDRKVQLQAVFNKTFYLEDQLKARNESYCQSSERPLIPDVDLLNQRVDLLFQERTARQQDFLALVNMTTNLNKRISESEFENDNKIQKLKTSVNYTNNDVVIINQNVRKLEQEIQSLNQTSVVQKIQSMDLIIGNLHKSSEKVAFTACATYPYERFSSGTPVKFSALKFEVGVQNIHSFQNSGVFTCEKSGLYAVYVALVSNTYDAFVTIFKQRAISGAYVSYERNNLYYSGSAAAAIQLDVGEKIFIRSERDDLVVHDYSCVTVMKIN